MSNFYFSDILGGRRKSPGPRLERDVIDVDYTEVKEDAKMSNVDKLLRAQQISEAAQKHFKAEGGLSSLLNAMLFSIGATWADEHPRNSFPSTSKWHNAMADELGKHKPDDEAGSDPVYNAMLLLTFAAGANWAVENPYKRV